MQIVTILWLASHLSNPDTVWLLSASVIWRADYTLAQALHLFRLLLPHLAGVIFTRYNYKLVNFAPTIIPLPTLGITVCPPIFCAYVPYPIRFYMYLNNLYQAGFLYTITHTLLVQFGTGISPPKTPVFNSSRIIQVHFSTAIHSQVTWRGS